MPGEPLPPMYPPSPVSQLTPQVQFLDPFGGAVDPTGAVVKDLPCRRCSYNLRGLSVNGRCPECGTPVATSARGGDILRFSDPVWLRQLVRGISLMLWGLGAILALFAVAILCIVTRTEMDLPVSVGALVGHVLNFIGSWLVTIPDPSGLGEDRYGRSRRLIRVTLLIGVLEQILTLGSGRLWETQAVATVGWVLMSVCAIAGAVGLIAELHYLAKLAARIPDSGLAARGRWLKQWFAGPIALFVGFDILDDLAGGGLRSSARVFVGCFGAVLGIVLIVAILRYVRFLLAMRRALRALTTESIAAWQAATDSADLRSRR